MFDFVRNHQRWMQFILLLLILPSFVFVGVQGYSSFVDSGTSYAKVGSASISQQQYENAQRARLEQLRGQFGSNFDPQMFDTPEARKQLLDSLIETRVVAGTVAASHFSASDRRLQDTILAIPAVQEDGKFSMARYQAALAAQGMTPAMFEAQLRNDLAQQTVTAPVADSGTLPKTVFDNVVAAQGQQREVRLLTLPATGFTAQVTVSDDDVKKYYDANTARFSVPEKVDAEYIVLDEKAAAADASVSTADVESYYKQNEAKFSAPEQRRASHILLTVDDKASDADRAKVLKKAEELAAQAKAKPADFAALAKANSQDPGSAASGGDLDWFGRGMMVKQFEDTAFSMKQGEISAPVKSDFGYHIIQVTGVRPAQVKPLAEVRPQIETEIRQQKASARYAELAEQFTNLIYEQSDSLKPAADKLGLKVQTAAGVTRSPNGPPSAPGISDNRKVIDALFSEEVLKESRNSGAIEVGTGTLVAVRVVKHNPAHTAPLADVSARIRTQLTNERAAALAKKAGEERLAALKAKDDETGFGASRQFSRRQSAQDVPAAVVGGVMRADVKTLPTFIGVDTGNGYTIARIGKVDAAPALDADRAKAEREQIARRVAAAEQEAVMKVLREQNKVQVTPAGDAFIKRAPTDAG
jgi:peptidyl-prolyl cis-trans isomerase D